MSRFESATNIMKFWNTKHTAGTAISAMLRASAQACTSTRRAAITLPASHHSCGMDLSKPREFQNVKSEQTYQPQTGHQLGRLAQQHRRACLFNFSKVCRGNLFEIDFPKMMKIGPASLGCTAVCPGRARA